MVSHQIIGTRK